jgi:hypothetical protein
MWTPIPKTHSRYSHSKSNTQKQQTPPKNSTGFAGEFIALNYFLAYSSIGLSFGVAQASLVLWLIA